MANLDREESESLGQLMQQTAFALSTILQPAKIHFGIYAEEVRHIHVHVFPRMPNMPPGNTANIWINQWMNILHAIKLKKAYPDEIVATYADRLRLAYLTRQK